jgi:acyl-CoA thioester hydrolase
MSTWSAPVRYAEVDQQGVVFNAHYLLYCDEAMGAFCAERGILPFAERVRLATSTLTWHGPASWGESLAVDARCIRVGTTSATIAFDITTDGRPCCAVETVYVYADEDGRPRPIADDVRAALTRHSP